MWSDVGTEIVVETGLAFDFGPLASSIRRLIYDASRDRVDRRVEQQHEQLNSAASLGAPWPPYGLAGSALGLRTVSLGAPWSPYGLAGSALGCAPCAACADPAACAADSVNVWKHSKRLPRATEVLFHRRFGNSQNSLRVLPHCIDTELLVDGIDRSKLVFEI